VQAANGFRSRDGTAPAELRRIADEQLAPYPAVERRRVGVDRIDNDPDVFRASLGDGSSVAARRVILATGLIDELPAIDGLAERWGISAFNCAHCDGWEVRDQPLAVLGADDPNLRLALTLTRFTTDVQLCTNGAAEPASEHAGLLRQRGVEVHTEPVVRLEGPGTDLQRIVFADGSTLDRRYVFCHAATRQASTIPDELALERLDDGSIKVDDLAQTSVPGVFAAGDIARRPTMPMAGHKSPSPPAKARSPRSRWTSRCSTKNWWDSRSAHWDSGRSYLVTSGSVTAWASLTVPRRMPLPAPSIADVRAVPSKLHTVSLRQQWRG
jgi:thioredoxin reductase